MTKILGLDLGTTSIGWAIIKEEEGNNEILGLGCRIIPYSENEAGDFTQGKGESKNHQRTVKRTQRKGYDRYQLRRFYLREALQKHGLMPQPELFTLGALDLYALREKALEQKLDLAEIGRICFHLNQRRGYKHGAREDSSDKKQREFVEKINSRYEEIREKMTVGQYFFRELQIDSRFRIKEKIFPRVAYMEEFDSIWEKQAEYYPDILTQELKKEIRNEIIYYQRQLKSQKRLVSICDFEGFWVENKKSGKTGHAIFVGPHVAPRSSPLFQAEKIWESINTISVSRIDPETKKYTSVRLDTGQRQKLFEFLAVHEKITEEKLFDLLGLDKENLYTTNAAVKERGIQGDLTRTAIVKCLKGYDFPGDLVDLALPDEDYDVVDQSTGELMKRKRIGADVEKCKYYRLWHSIYSIQEKDQLFKVLTQKFAIPEANAEKLCNLDFTKGGYSNKSAKAIRNIIPYLQDGFVYSDACLMAGYRHSDSLTTEEQYSKDLLDRLPLLHKNSLRQPIVEKILNQMINVVNAVIEKHGRPDEIRVELARGLKQSRKERNDTYLAISAKDRQNKIITDRLEKEYGVKGNRRNIEKWRLFHEVGGRCLYCNKPITLSQVLKGVEADVEHIIPRSIYFDDSFSNKTISHVACNKAKNQMTAFDFMNSKPAEELNNYIQRVNDLFHTKGDREDEGAQCLVNKITRIKYQRLLMERKEIPQDFISRQLRETQYIARKAREILEQVSVRVHATSGTVTERLRHLWGWDEILQHLQLPRYRMAGMTEWTEIQNNGTIEKKEIITGWSKRMDNRHHAIDALTIASTKQGFIQRINTLSSEHTRSELLGFVKDQQFTEKLTLIEKYLISQKPFTTDQVNRQVSSILISFKSGKKVATIGVRKARIKGNQQVVQKDIIVPRGALSEEQVYGKIRRREVVPLKKLFEQPDRIVSPKIKLKITERLGQFENDVKKAVASCKKSPICHTGKETPIENAQVFIDEVVFKYPLASLKSKDVEFIVDPRVRELIRTRLEAFGNKEKDAFRDLENNPVWFNEKERIPVKTVRCYTGLTSVVPLKTWDDGSVKGFVKPGNNHHIAIYEDESGNKLEHVVTFWHAVERKKFGFPVIMENPEDVWSSILTREDIPPSFLDKLPGDKWRFVISMQQNEMFLMGLTDEVIQQALVENNYSLLSHHLYRVQKLGSSDFTFRHHLETQIENSKEAGIAGKFIRVQSLSAFSERNPHKVVVNIKGELVPDRIKKLL